MNDSKNTQHARVLASLAGGEWKTLAEIAQEAGIQNMDSAAAQVRSLRKAKFGGHVVERRHEDGLRQVRIVVAS